MTYSKSWLFALCAILPFVAPDSSPRPIYAINDIKVGFLQAKDTGISQFLIELSDRTHVLFCVENLTGDEDLAVKVTLTIHENERLDEILNSLQRQYPSIHWMIDNNVIVIRATAAARLSDNPLDANIPPFEFTGKLDKLISYLNKEVDGLHAASWTESPQIYLPEYHLRFDSEVTVRDVLCALARNYGIRWYAEIKPVAAVPNRSDSRPMVSTRVHLNLLPAIFTNTCSVISTELTICR